MKTLITVGWLGFVVVILSGCASTSFKPISGRADYEYEADQSVCDSEADSAKHRYQEKERFSSWTFGSYGFGWLAWVFNSERMYAATYNACMKGRGYTE